MNPDVSLTLSPKLSRNTHAMHADHANHADHADTTQTIRRPYADHTQPTRIHKRMQTTIISKSIARKPHADITNTHYICRLLMPPQACSYPPYHRPHPHDHQYHTQYINAVYHRQRITLLRVLSSPSFSLLI